MVYAATEGFFNEILNESSSRAIPLNPDKLRSAGAKCGVRLFTREWGVRTRVKGDPPGGGNRSRWKVFEGDELRKYLRDMKELRDLLSHGGDPYSVANVSGALWVQNKGNSMNLMGWKVSFKLVLIWQVRRFWHSVGVLITCPSGLGQRGRPSPEKSFLR